MHCACFSHSQVVEYLRGLHGIVSIMQCGGGEGLAEYALFDFKTQCWLAIDHQQ